MRLRQVLYIMIILYTESTLCSQVCSDIMTIAGSEGENVILDINETEVKEISWLLGRHHIVTTEPGKIIHVKKRKLSQRLEGTDQGSLKIINLHMEDQGNYSATVFKEKQKDCVQNFWVKVYPKLLKKDIEIKINVSETESCNMTLTCTANNPYVRISWRNQTEGYKVVRNHTLNLNNIHPTTIYHCIAETPVIRISRSVRPWTFCQKETAIGLAPRAGSPSIWIMTVAIMTSILELMHCL
ncbi:SLAM family member 8-like [Bufo gargarizans]|uniref:SLAM family member 8-like n=1 Tax=Bufo gargarizans TaxID=30331 RepID=UPI001CF2E6A2|nr:SLAM family member 8-like [Bufo gargarizans]